MADGEDPRDEDDFGDEEPEDFGEEFDEEPEDFGEEFDEEPEDVGEGADEEAPLEEPDEAEVVEEEDFQEAPTDDEVGQELEGTDGAPDQPDDDETAAESPDDEAFDATVEGDGPPADHEGGETDGTIDEAPPEQEEPAAEDEMIGDEPSASDVVEEEQAQAEPAVDDILEEEGDYEAEESGDAGAVAEMAADGPVLQREFEEVQNPPEPEPFEPEPLPEVGPYSEPATLTVYVDGEERREFAVDQDVTVVGRAPDEPESDASDSDDQNDRLPAPDLALEVDSDSVWRRHVTLYRHNKHYTLHVDATAPTQVGEELLDIGAMRELDDGDVVVVGEQTALAFSLPESGSTAGAGEPSDPAEADDADLDEVSGADVDEEGEPVDEPEGLEDEEVSSADVDEEGEPVDEPEDLEAEEDETPADEEAPSDDAVDPAAEEEPLADDPEAPEDSSPPEEWDEDPDV